MPSIACATFTRLLVSMIVGITPATDEMEARIKDGGIRVGSPDPSTTDIVLRLRTGDADGYVVFGVDWDRIASVRYKSEVWTPDMFAALRQEIANTLQAERLVPQPMPGNAVHSQPLSTRPLWQAPERPGPSESVSPRVQFIEIDAVAANWDANPEWDGLVVRVWPMDMSGHVIQVSGTLSASLIGDAGYSTSAATTRLAHWVRAVRPSDYGQDGINVRLKFQNFEPERWDAAGHPDHRIGPYGEVHVSFAIPGHGVFRASTVTPVRLRRFSPERDRAIRNGER